jgi:hypothetical protein
VGEDGKPIWQPPDPAKFVAEENGVRIALWGKPVWNGQRWVRGYDQKVTTLEVVMPPFDGEPGVLSGGYGRAPWAKEREETK